MKLRIYADTSVLGGCDDAEFAEHSVRLLDGFIRGERLLVLSSLTVQELATAPPSVRSRLATVPDTLALAPQIKCPVLCIRGDQEDRDRYPAEEFQARAGGSCEVQIVPNCDHFYNGREHTIQALVSSWLERVLGLAPAGVGDQQH